jgi:hypothetical protein
VILSPLPDWIFPELNALLLRQPAVSYEIRLKDSVFSLGYCSDCSISSSQWSKKNYVTTIHG